MFKIHMFQILELFSPFSFHCMHQDIYEFTFFTLIYYEEYCDIKIYNTVIVK